LTRKKQGRDIHLNIHLSFHLASFTGCAPRVHDDLRVQSSEYHNANDPIRIPQHGPPQQRSRQVDGKGLPRNSHICIEAIHVIVRPVAVDLERGLFSISTCLRVPEVCQGDYRSPGFEVRLAVQIHRLHKRHILLLRRRANENVRRNAFVVENLDKVAHTNVFPVDRFPMDRVVVILYFPLRNVLASPVREDGADEGFAFGLRGVRIDESRAGKHPGPTIVDVPV